MPPGPFAPSSPVGARNPTSQIPVRPASMMTALEGASRMNAFWQTWRREIIRGAVLFGGVIAIGLCVRYVIPLAGQGDVDNLPSALRIFRGLRGIKNIPNNFRFQPAAYREPRDLTDTWQYKEKDTPQH